MIKLHELDLRSCKFSEVLINTEFLIEVRSLASGCCLPDELLTIYVQQGARSLLIRNVTGENIWITDSYCVPSVIVVVAEDLDAIQFTTAEANSTSYAKQLKLEQQGARWGITKQ